MGQYHMPANLDRKEFLYPHVFGDGLKMMEFTVSANGTMQGLGLLLAASNRGGARGGGDLHPWSRGDSYGDERETPITRSKEYEGLLMDHVVGRWAGDRIAIIGDYHEDDDVPGYTDQKFGEGDEEIDLWSAMSDEKFGWIDISQIVIEAMELDFYTWTARHEVMKNVNGEPMMRGDEPWTRARPWGDLDPAPILEAGGTIRPADPVEKEDADASVQG